VRAGGRDSAGGYQQSVEYDLDCLADCMPTSLDWTVELDNVTGFGDSRMRSLFVGHDDGGELSAVAAMAGTLSNIPLRIGRTGEAVAERAPTGHVAILGGESSGTVELLLP
jgi:hypothetical protein